VQVPARGGHGRVPKRLLHEVDGRAAVEAVAGVRMAEPKGAPGFTHENDSYRELFWDPCTRAKWAYRKV
jgi:hypothetical protein